jgi:hypothetical protein
MSAKTIKMILLNKALKKSLNFQVTLGRSLENLKRTKMMNCQRLIFYHTSAIKNTITKVEIMRTT